jgi:ketosteroid isomerase-like protein
MKALFATIAAAFAAFATPALAEDQPSEEHAAVTSALFAFLDAIASDDKTLLAGHMIPEAVIFVHNRMDPANPRVDVVPVAQHLERWAKSTRQTFELMDITSIIVDGDMAQVWGPYSFEADGAIAHCGINSLSMVRTGSGWKVGNTSFTMVPPEQCEAVGAEWVVSDDH